MNLIQIWMIEVEIDTIFQCILEVQHIEPQVDDENMRISTEIRGQIIETEMWIIIDRTQFLSLWIFKKNWPVEIMIFLNYGVIHQITS